MKHTQTTTPTQTAQQCNANPMQLAHKTTQMEHKHNRNLSTMPTCSCSCTCTCMCTMYKHNTYNVSPLPPPSPFLSCCPDSGLCPRRSERDSGGLRRRQQQSRQHHSCLGLCAGDCESGMRGGEGFSVGTAQEVMIYMYMYMCMCTCTYTCSCVRMLHVTVCLRTLPYLLSLVIICIYMYEIDHVLYIHTYMYTIRTCTLHVQYMYTTCTCTVYM